MTKPDTGGRGEGRTAHTPGPWFCSQESIDPEWWIVTIEGGLIVANVNAHHCQETNARLIAEAGTVATETGLTPRQLADRCADLVKALESCQRVLADLVGGDKSLSTINIYAQAVEAELKARATLSSSRSDQQ